MFDDTAVDDLTTCGVKDFEIFPEDAAVSPGLHTAQWIAGFSGIAGPGNSSTAESGSMSQRVTCRVTQEMPGARVGVPVMFVKTNSLLGYIVKPTFDLT